MRTVLVIEDNNELREEIADILRYAGYEVQEASNGKEGIEIATSSSNDVILCDLMMPEMDGFEVLRKLNKSIDTALVPVVVLSALSERKNMRDAMEIGANDYLIKPFTHQELLNTIQSQLTKTEWYNQQIRSIQDKIFFAIPHEFKSPLNVISGYGSMIRDGEFPLSEIKKMGESIVASAEKLNSIITKYLIYIDLALNSGKIELSPITITQDYFVSFSTRMSRLHKRENDLNINAEPFRARLKLRQDLLFFAYQEILDNAFKFSSPGQKVSIKFNSTETHFWFSIIDSGRGFPAGKLNSIQALVQFDRTTYEQKGIGMGLFLSQKIIELHHGNLKISSGKKSGTKVEISLPVNQNIFAEI